MEQLNKHLRDYVIDRFEGEYTILLDSNGRQYDVVTEDLPNEVVEGDILKCDDGIFAINEEETKIQREKIKDIKERLELKY